MLRALLGKFIPMTNLVALSFVCVPTTHDRRHTVKRWLNIPQPSIHTADKAN